MSLCEDDSGDETPVPQEDRALTQGALHSLATKLEDLSTCNELIGKHGAALQRSLSELEDLRGPTEGTDKVKAVNERATLFRITSNAMINVSSHSSYLCWCKGLKTKRISCLCLLVRDCSEASEFAMCFDVCCVHTSGLSGLFGCGRISQPAVAESSAL